MYILILIDLLNKYSFNAITLTASYYLKSNIRVMLSTYITNCPFVTSQSHTNYPPQPISILSKLSTKLPGNESLTEYCN